MFKAIRDARGSAEGSALRHDALPTAKPLRLAGVEPELQIVGRQDGGVADGFAWADAGGDDCDFRLRVGVVEEGDGIAFAGAAVDDAVGGSRRRRRSSSASGSRRY